MASSLCSCVISCAKVSKAEQYPRHFQDSIIDVLNRLSCQNPTPEDRQTLLTYRGARPHQKHGTNEVQTCPGVPDRERTAPCLQAKKLRMLSWRLMNRPGNEAPVDDKGAYLFEALSTVTKQLEVKLTTIGNSTDYVRFWFTDTLRASCADNKID
ncbi:hypothetical protein N7489_007231 [Penicillium chrysogenum]|uniref:Uncharacterized protein n=1 Tax=Penicillium chrysogenum TaxID=5076 RepID=A0ABQ8W5W4_PENCH|nr:uncharacterized protein N7489_007231 [Penicillium chrysogenum]KAJ5237140.1 hypothetical protein N7489_007231 [Penicillium chrysogenum]KAJ5256075.1 hypothetical protein N7505_011226 [Penicillium chrysogenum]KAJ5277099.1 hypothetical protein N7524_003252 [Penicillium chrysogenum]KAJ6152155.1 hypothetical protein N7497_006474 [Penicillium chrysogenum]